eukprot:TRINITY_DN9771_c0_g1_i1.p1 TRINITY_DN9771_c0_g1~~TRINITY_DN9771_c0_g1_i1.p1  ORF type:complete len:362 (+),score=119.63 TRINITY_DN9771_c0_g1_i1:535-1620(+)
MESDKDVELSMLVEEDALEDAVDPTGAAHADTAVTVDGERAGASQEGSILKPYTIGLCFTWIFLNVLLSITNKWLFRVEHFAYPVMIIMLGTLMTFIGSATLLLVFKYEPVPSTEEIMRSWKVLLVNSLAVGLSTGLENISILYTSISLNQAIKACLPAVAMAAAYLLEGRTYSAPLIGLNFVMIVGVVLALLHNPSFSVFGFSTAVVSTVLNLVHVMASAELLRRPHMTSMVVMMLSAPPALLSLFPLFMWLEYPTLAQRVPRHEMLDILVMFCTAVVAFVYVLLGLELVRVTSAVYFTIVSNLKVVVLVVVSTLVFVNALSQLNMLGLFITFLSFCSYNVVKAREEERQRRLASAGFAP